jgi:hypothetical protein
MGGWLNRDKQGTEMSNSPGNADISIIHVIFTCNIMGIILRFQILFYAILLRKTLYETIDNTNKSILFCSKTASYITKPYQHNNSRQPTNL